MEMKGKLKMKSFRCFDGIYKLMTRFSTLFLWYSSADLQFPVIRAATETLHYILHCLPEFMS